MDFTSIRGGAGERLKRSARAVDGTRLIDNATSSELMMEIGQRVGFDEGPMNILRARHFKLLTQDIS